MDQNTLSTEELTFNVPHICISALYNSYSNWGHSKYREAIYGKKAVTVMTTSAPV